MDEQILDAAALGWRRWVQVVVVVAVCGAFVSFVRASAWPSSEALRALVGLLLALGLLPLGWHLLRLLVGRDRVAWSATGVTVERGLRDWRRTRVVPRQAVLDVTLLNDGQKVALLTREGDVLLSELGSEAERLRLLQALRATLGLQPGGAAEALPAGWRAREDAGRVTLAFAPSRRQWAQEVLTLAAGLGAVWAAVALPAVRDAWAFLLGAAGLLFVAGAGSALALREAWVFEGARVSRVRRFFPFGGFTGRALTCVSVRQSRDAQDAALFQVRLEFGGIERVLLTTSRSDEAERLAVWVAARGQVPVQRSDV